MVTVPATTVAQRTASGGSASIGDAAEAADLLANLHFNNDDDDDELEYVDVEDTGPAPPAAAAPAAPAAAAAAPAAAPALAAGVPQPAALPP